MIKPKNVDAYIRMAPKEVQGKLKEVRAAIKKGAPKALEKISYGMPYYGYNGRVAYFAFAKNHIGFYVMPPVIENNKKLLEKYSKTKATIRLPLNEKIPKALITRLIKERMKMNED